MNHQRVCTLLLYSVLFLSACSEANPSFDTCPTRLNTCDFESCNGKDDDFDGQIDESLTQPCVVSLNEVYEGDAGIFGQQIAVLPDQDGDGLDELLAVNAPPLAELDSNSISTLEVISSNTGNILWLSLIHI